MDKVKIHGMCLENIERQDLKPLQGDLKILSEKNYQKLKKSFSEKGLFVPMVVWKDKKEYKILDGHGRSRLFEKEAISFVDEKGNPTSKIPCLVIEANSLKDAKEKLLIISSQYQTITQEGLDAFAFDLDDDWLASTVGFDGLSFDPGLASGGGDDLEPREGEDDVPEAPENTKTIPGAIYKLGNHLLMCGDSTIEGHVTELLGGNRPSLVFTDPPYGVSVNETNWIPNQKRGPAFDHKLQNDDLRGSALTSFIHKAFELAFKFSDDMAAFYCWSAPLEAGCDIFKGFQASGIHVQGQIIWVKPSLSLGQSDYQWRHEICWYGYKKTKGKKHHWLGGRDKTTVWEESRESDGSHPTMKPVSLAERAIRNHLKSGFVFDPFSGAGSTLIACEKQGVNCLAMEIEPKYCDVIVKRWEDFSGEKTKIVK